MTASTFDRNRRASLAVGMNDYTDKPVQINWVS
jgi:CheY-like chemotaxis protein